MIHERIRKAREAQGLTLRAVAEAAGVDDGHLSRFERGESQMGSAAMGRVLAALGLEVVSASQLDADGRVLVPADATDGGALIDQPSPIDLTPRPSRRSLDTSIG